MRIFLAKNGNPTIEGPLAINAEEPSPIPEHLRSALGGAPLLNGAAFSAAELARALGLWEVSRDDPQPLAHEEDFCVSLLPMALLLGRDLVLLDQGDLKVCIQ